jgi:hypothetical protein
MYAQVKLIFNVANTADERARMTDDLPLVIASLKKAGLTDHAHITTMPNGTHNRLYEVHGVSKIIDDTDLNNIKGICRITGAGFSLVSIT